MKMNDYDGCKRRMVEKKTGNTRPQWPKYLDMEKVDAIGQLSVLNRVENTSDHLYLAIIYSSFT